MRLLLLWLILSGTALAQPVRVAFVNQAPLMIEADGRRSGPGFPLVEELLFGLPVSPPQEMPGRRILYGLQHEPMIALNLTRTADREALGLVWVVEICRDEQVFGTLAGRPAISTFEQARAVPRIGVVAGGTAESLLYQHGMTNFDNVGDIHSQAAKLHAGRVGALFGVRVPMQQAWREMGFSAGDLQMTPSGDISSIWIAASSLVDPKLIEELRGRFRALTADRQPICPVL